MDVFFSADDPVKAVGNMGAYGKGNTALVARSEDVDFRLQVFRWIVFVRFPEFAKGLDEAFPHFWQLLYGQFCRQWQGQSIQVEEPLQAIIVLSQVAGWKKKFS